MKLLCRKLTIALLLGGYFLAVTAGGAFHTHLRHDCAAEASESSDTCPGSACCEGRSHQVPSRFVETSESPALQVEGVPFDPYCPICSFLSQKPVPVAVYSIEDSAELGQPLVRVRAIAPSDDIPTTVFGRGPPPIA